MTGSFHNLMLCSLAVYFVVAKPLSCKEDEHCSEGYYCDTQAHECYPCLRCKDMNRMILELHASNSCIKFCGPCMEGFVNIGLNDFKGKCVSPEVLQYESKSYCVYIWITALSIGFFVMLIFVYIIKNTAVFHLVSTDLLSKLQENRARVRAMCLKN